MQSYTNNIFSTAGEDSASQLQAFTQTTKDFGISLLQKIQQLLSSIAISDSTSERISQNFGKAKQFFAENKEVVLGVTLIAGLYVANEARAKNLKNSKSKHIHSLTTNPNSPLKRSGSHKKQSAQLQIDSPQKPQRKSKKLSVPKLHYLRAFISEAEQQEDSDVGCEGEDKENADLSTSTRRTESILSDIECMKKKRRTNLKPILDLVEEEEQTQDRVFFEMYRTYRES